MPQNCFSRHTILGPVVPPLPHRYLKTILISVSLTPFLPISVPVFLHVIFSLAFSTFTLVPTSLTLSLAVLYLPSLSGHIQGLEAEVKHVKGSLSNSQMEKRQLQHRLTDMEKVRGLGRETVGTKRKTID